MIGVDPGLSGGVCLVSKKGEAIDYIRMANIAEIDDFFDKARGLYGNVLTCVFEEHHGGGEKTNAAAHESRGKFKAIFETLCHVHKVPMVLVTPQTWKAHFGLIQKAVKGAPKVPVEEKRKLAKAASCKLAKELFPAVNLVFPRCSVEHDGVAESLLLAEYYRRVSNAAIKTA